jgi:hypothetical protein
MYCWRFSAFCLALFCALDGNSAAHAETRLDREWFILDKRAVQQQGLEHRVCSVHTAELILCFEFIWNKGSLTFWSHISAPAESDLRFQDRLASDFWIDGQIHGGEYRGKLTGSTNSMLDIDRFLGFEEGVPAYYRYGGSWQFLRFVVAAPADYKTNPLTFFSKLRDGSHLRLVHYLEGGETFETEYDLAGLAPLLTSALEEAAAMAHKYANPAAAE